MRWYRGVQKTIGLVSLLSFGRRLEEGVLLGGKVRGGGEGWVRVKFLWFGPNHRNRRRSESRVADGPGGGRVREKGEGVCFVVTKPEETKVRPVGVGVWVLRIGRGVRTQPPSR